MKVDLVVTIDQTSAQGPTVAVLMGVFNGAAYLDQQVASIAAQTHTRWTIYASDDGSVDASTTVLAAAQAQLGSDRIRLHTGPGEGFTRNFFSLLKCSDISADFYAYCDQDDIWETEKLASAVEWLETIPSHIPALHCSRTHLIKMTGIAIGLSPAFRITPSFRHALVQNIAGGNTMVFNSAARQLLAKSIEHMPKNALPFAHDWWTYILIAGVGGMIQCDPRPLVRYRQHSDNVLGQNFSLMSRLHRAIAVANGRLKTLVDQNLCALEPMMEHLTDENKVVFKHYISSRNSSGLVRLRLLKQCGIHRDTRLGNIGLALAALFGQL